MKTYKSLLKEAKAKSAVMVFGRFNPPTIGHGNLQEMLLEDLMQNYMFMEVNLKIQKRILCLTNKR